MDWFGRQIDKAIDKEINSAINKAVEKEIDDFLGKKIGKDQLRRVKKLAKEGKPLDKDTEVLLRKYLSEEELEQYRKIHNGVAEAERVDKECRKVENGLKEIDDFFR